MKTKAILLEQISKIENEELVNSISSMISTINDQGIFEIDETTKRELNARSETISSGEYIEHKEVIKKFKK